MIVYPRFLCWTQTSLSVVRPRAKKGIPKTEAIQTEGNIRPKASMLQMSF